MSELAIQLPPDEVVPSEFGIVGVIGLAATEAMRRHDVTVETMRTKPAEDLAAIIKTQIELLDGFAAEYPEAGWNGTSEDELTSRFEQFTAKGTGE